MDRDKFIRNKFITVAGRASSPDEFARDIRKKLFDNFDVVAIHKLGEFGVDDKERFLAFVTGESETGKTFDAQREKFLSNTNFGAHVHTSLEDAYDYSMKNYPTFGEYEQQKVDEFQRVQENFPPFTAAEVEQYGTFDSYMETGRIHQVRAKLDDVPCVVLVSVAPGSDEVRVRPFAIMVNDEIQEKLEFPDDEKI